jgi:hypothetical protein
MGKASDKNAVVDSNANVIGVNGLRVVDASAFPFLPPGHPMATVCKSQELSATCPHVTNGDRCFGREDCGSDHAPVLILHQRLHQ